MQISTPQFIDRMRAVNLQHSGTMLVEDVALEPDEFFANLSSIGLEPIPSSEGLVSRVREDYDPVDFNRRGGNFDFHTDGLYYTLVPEFVVLYCVVPGTGMTRTTFADTRPVAATILDTPELLFLKNTELVWLGKDARDYAQPLIHAHPRTGEPVMHATGRGFLRPTVTANQLAEMPSLREFIRMQQAWYDLIDRHVCKRHQWKKGDLILFDNCTFVHAREAYGHDPHRELLRIWLTTKGSMPRNRKPELNQIRSQCRSGMVPADGSQRQFTSVCQRQPVVASHPMAIVYEQKLAS